MKGNILRSEKWVWKTMFLDGKNIINMSVKVNIWYNSKQDIHIEEIPEIRYKKKKLCWCPCLPHMKILHILVTEILQILNLNCANKHYTLQLFRVVYKNTIDKSRSWGWILSFENYCVFLYFGYIDPGYITEAS